MTGPQITFLPDGRRLHLNHGPIDLIVDAEGPGREAALADAARRFGTILDELVAELPRLRRPLDAQPFGGTTAQRMARAVAPFAEFVTPMAAVAGSVADEILSAMTRRTLTKAYVNNGGDIALHLAPGASFTAASPAGPVTIRHGDAARGLATSGWRGRSHSLGIADAVTVLARTAAEADAAATLIANAVDLPGHLSIKRTPARDLAPDSDLGDRPVTTGVGPLSPGDTATALAAGLAAARRYRMRNLILAASLTLNGQTVTTEEVLAHA
ncbi:UPF0280 family protein [Silicimonas algicola]|uniref:Uncharacterized protein n=1 Tax=Silicimonas algicola TaxID=1826607 RepID=A0A316GCX2_9RHOB|nr:UPF0280 family protein [Silicimonas algicola]AZQ66453.1 UPF0280 family protein [Silicimonas algicola]PWK58791.1 hypothetical protein C8D95_101607 [Silicimonas algicola]